MSSVCNGGTLAGRSPAVDGLRGIAATAVLMQHFAMYRPWAILPSGTVLDALVTWALDTAATWGGLGVPIFFVLSGYCVGRTWLRATSWQSFAQRRVWRIYPKYLASLPLALLMSWSDKGFYNPCDGLRHVAAVGTIMTWPATYYRPFQVVYWTLTYEVAFYCILTAVLIVPRRVQTAALIAVATAGSLLTLVPQIAEFPGPFFVVCMWPVFALGLALAAARIAPIGGAVVASAAFAGLCVVDEVIRSRGYAAISLVTLGALMVIDRTSFRFPVGAMAHVGEVSYGLYVTHVPVLRLFGSLLPASLSLPFAAIAFLSTLALQLLVAMLFRRLLGPGKTFNPHGPGGASTA